MKKSELNPLARLICREGAISRAALSEKTRSAPSYITVLVRNLQKKQWLLEGSRLPTQP
jgi:phenylpyruvate tautomerase PptA (4-oxalocrotonate tautomerase family)